MAGVNPWGAIYSTIAKNGTWMGNRGRLRKDGNPTILRPWEHRTWVYCLCAGERIEVAYTKLFFFDEATTLAAGHRPCRHCQRERHDAFKRAWIQGNPEYGFAAETSITLIDKVLEKDRKNERKEKRTFQAKLGELPEGVIVALPGGDIWLYRDGLLRRWTPTGYTTEIPAHKSLEVAVLTPRSTVNAIRCGFRPV